MEIGRNCSRPLHRGTRLPAPAEDFRRRLSLRGSRHAYRFAVVRLKISYWSRSFWQFAIVMRQRQSQINTRVGRRLDLREYMFAIQGHDRHALFARLAFGIFSPPNQLLRIGAPFDRLTLFFFLKYPTRSSTALTIKGSATVASSKTSANRPPSSGGTNLPQETASVYVLPLSPPQCTGSGQMRTP